MITRRSKYTYDETYFTKWSFDMAYIVGFICADGSIKPMTKKPDSYQLQIGVIDFDIIEKIRNIIAKDTPITRNQSKNLTTKGHLVKPVYSINICNQPIIKPLIAMGIGPRKTYNMAAVVVPDEYFWSFLRGYTDGNGSFGKYLMRPNYYLETISWAGGTKLFLEGLRDKIQMFFPELNSKVSEICKPTRKGGLTTTFILRYGGTSALKILEKIYDEHTTLAMDRKKEVYAELLRKEPCYAS